MSDPKSDESTENKNFRDDLKEGLSDLGNKVDTFTDRMKVQLNLGSKEAKRLYEDNLEPAIDRLRSEVKAASGDLDTATDTAEVKAHLAFMEVKERWGHLREHVDGVVHSMKSKGETKVDEAKLKAKLASMEADDAVSDRTKRAQEKLESAADVVKSETKKGLADIREAMDDLISKIG